MDYPLLSIKYNASSKFLQEAFKVQLVSVGGVMNFLQKSEHEFVFLIKAKGTGSHEELSNIGSSLSWISIEAE